jgi:hypothetical protein
MQNNNNHPVFYGAQNGQAIPFFRITTDYKAVKDFIHNKVLAAFTNNAYRILDLSVVSTEEDIIVKTNSSLKKVNLGIDIGLEFGVDLFDDLIVNENLLLSARNRLLNPETRLKERLFWFSTTDKWPLSELNGSYLRLADFLNIFYDSFSNKELSIAQSYTLSQIGLILLAIDDYQLESIDSWIDIYNIIFYLINKQDFWLLFNVIEREGQFSKTVKYSALDYKSRVVDIILEPLILIAEQHIRSGAKQAFNALKVISKLNLEVDCRNEIEDRLLNIIEDDIVLTTDKIIGDCASQITRNDDSIEHNKNVCDSALNLFNNQVLPKFHNYTDMPVAITKKKRLKERIAHFYKLMASHITWADDYITAEELLMEAKILVEVGSVDWIEIEERLEKISGYALIQRTYNAASKTNNQLLYGDNNVFEVCPNCRQEIYAPVEICSGCNSKISNVAYEKRASQKQSNVKVSNEKQYNYTWLYIGIAIIAVIIFFSTLDTTSGPTSAPAVNTGRVEYLDGHYYGDLVDGTPHGHGTLTYTNGDKYVGNFKDDSFHGSGTYTWNDGSRFVGTWHNGEVLGKGTYHYTNGDQIKSDSWRGVGNALKATYIYSNGAQEDVRIVNYEFVD